MCICFWSTLAGFDYKCGKTPFYLLRAMIGFSDKCLQLDTLKLEKGICFLSTEFVFAFSYFLVIAIPKIRLFKKKGGMKEYDFCDL